MQKPFIFINGRKGFRGTVVKSHLSIAGFSPAKKNHILRGKTHSLIGVVPLLLSVVLALLLQSCVKRLAVNSIANALTEGSTSVYARDDDPVLVGAALPFALKTMETLLEQTPDNKKLLIATAAGFVQYAHAFVLQPASTLEYTDLAAARDERDRAKRLFLRARSYALRALELEHDGITQRLTSDPKAAVSTAKPQDIPALYWTGVAWGSVDDGDELRVSDLFSVVTEFDSDPAGSPTRFQDGTVHGIIHPRAAHDLFTVVTSTQPNLVDWLHTTRGQGMFEKGRVPVIKIGRAHV